MAGLLEALQQLQFKPSPMNIGLMNAGSNMMAAGGPSLHPQNFGTAVGAGLQGLLSGYTGAETAAMEAQLRKAQLEQDRNDYDLNRQYKQAQIDKMTNPQKYTDPYYSPVETSQGLFKFDARTGTYEPMTANGKPLMRSTSDAGLQALITAGKEGQKGVKATDAQGREFYAPQTDLNQSFPNLLPNLIRTESSGNPNAVSPKGAQGLTQVMPATAQNPGFGVQPMANNSPDEQVRFGADYLRALIKHYNGDTQKALAAYNAGPGHVDQNGITNPGYVDKVMGPSDADKAALDVQKSIAKDTGKAEVDRQTAQAQREKDANDAIMILQQAAPLVNGSTGSGIGNMVDSAAAFFGKSMPGAESADQLKLLEGALVSKMPKMSGPQSDRDALLYKQMAASIGDPLIPIERKKKAMQKLADLQSKYAGVNGVKLDFSDANSQPTNTGGATGSWGNSGDNAEGGVKFLGFE
jgi:hypothetical protein